MKGPAVAHAGILGLAALLRSDIERIISAELTRNAGLCYAGDIGGDLECGIVLLDVNLYARETAMVAGELVFVAND